MVLSQKGAVNLDYLEWIMAHNDWDGERWCISPMPVKWAGVSYRPILPDKSRWLIKPGLGVVEKTQREYLNRIGIYNLLT